MDPSLETEQKSAEIGSRWGWPPGPVLLFAAVLALFAAVGLAGLWVHSPRPSGLPDDPAVAVARQLLAPGLPIGASPLRFGSALAGELSPDLPPGDDDETRLAAAERALAAAQLRHPGDPRLRAAFAHLDLACARLERAERRYREVLDRWPRYGEARLGLAVTLALAAAGAPGDESMARRLRLEALAQLAAVEADDPWYRVALYDRVVLLEHVGRSQEARRWAKRYLEVEPGSEWSKRLARMLALPPA